MKFKIGTWTYHGDKFTTIEHSSNGTVVLMIPGDNESARELAQIIITKLGLKT